MATPEGETPPVIPESSGGGTMRDATRGLMIGSGALMAIGAFLPWAQAGIFSIAGTSGDGVFPLIGGIVLAVTGITKKATTLIAVAVIVVSAFCLWVVVTTFNNLDAAAVGTGIYVSGLGCVLGAIAGVQTLGDRKRIPE